MRSLGIKVRAGLHTGECDKLGGVAVHIGARIAATASPGEILVSSTVKDLVTGSGLRFDDRGRHTLKGVHGAWRLFAVDQGQSRDRVKRERPRPPQNGERIDSAAAEVARRVTRIELPKRR